MIKSLILLVAVIFAFSHDTYTQSRKKIRDLDVESITEVELDYEDSNGQETLRFVTEYDVRGNIIKEKDYDKEGKLDKIITYEYNVDDDKIKEIHYKPNNKVSKTYTYSYERGKLTERKEYDENNKLISRNTYKYENGLKTERSEFDGSNRLVEKKKYIYKYRNN